MVVIYIYEIVNTSHLQEGLPRFIVPIICASFSNLVQEKKGLNSERCPVQ
jgi:hypothetical protein